MFIRAYTLKLYGRTEYTLCIKATYFDKKK